MAQLWRAELIFLSESTPTSTSTGEDNAKKTALSAVYLIKNPYLCAVLACSFLVFRQKMQLKILHFID